tara:strand:+ start:399 stop:647 length:249 start_codon:yes stop_codon:yes gene_type:complete
MSIFLLTGLGVLSLIVIGITFFVFFAWSAKKTLFKGQSVWSGKNIPIQRKGNREASKKPNGNQFLKSISLQTSSYLNDQEED